MEAIINFGVPWFSIYTPKQCVYGMFGICICNFACSCGISSLILCLLCYLLCGYNYIGYAQAQSQSSVS